MGVSWDDYRASFRDLGKTMCRTCPLCEQDMRSSERIAALEAELDRQIVLVRELEATITALRAALRS